jgi:hypothetical protein
LTRYRADQYDFQADPYEFRAELYDFRADPELVRLIIPL